MKQGDATAQCSPKVRALEGWRVTVTLAGPKVAARSELGDDLGEMGTFSPAPARQGCCILHPKPATTAATTAWQSLGRYSPSLACGFPLSSRYPVHSNSICRLASPRLGLSLVEKTGVFLAAMSVGRCVWR